jgi:hypothetical protein
MKIVKKKIICFDLDNVICKTYLSNYKKSIPIKKNIKLINDFYSNDYYIKIFTSRFMGRNNENILKAKKQGYNFTKKQLKKWKVSFHELIFGKPSYDIFIDDKMFGFKKSWSSKLRKKFRLI